MRKSSRSISFRAGHLEFVKINAANFDIRDTYHLILTLTWPRFAGMLLAIYILLFFFAGLYLLGGNCIAELPSGSFSDTFFFSVETLNTVGYGHMYPDTFYGHAPDDIDRLHRLRNSSASPVRDRLHLRRYSLEPPFCGNLHRDL